MSDTPSAISREDVVKLAHLARIELTADEQERLTGELGAILGAVASVSSAVDDSTPATSHPLPLNNVFRTDEARPGLTPQQALSGAPAEQDGRFRVPRILDEE